MWIAGFYRDMYGDIINIYKIVFEPRKNNTDKVYNEYLPFTSI